MKHLFGTRQTTLAVAVGLTLVGVQASACPSPFNYCAKHSTHVYETVASGSATTYVGTYFGNNEWRMAYCQVTATGAEVLTPLHAETSTGTKGPGILLGKWGVDAHQTQSAISICGTSSKNVIKGALAKYNGKCAGKDFYPVYVNNHSFKISGMGGDDEILGVVYSSLGAPQNPQATTNYCGNEGNDTLIVDYYTNVSSLPPPSFIRGGEGHDHLEQNLNYNTTCNGDAGEDTLWCWYGNCTGGPDSDECSCTNETTCEL